MANKKILDIISPQSPSLSPKKEEEISTPVLKEKKLPPKAIKRKFIISIIIIFLLFVGGSGYFKLSKAEIQIWPITENLNFQKKITVDSNINEVDLKNNILPGKILEIEKKVSQDFPATGKKMKKAEGVIRVFNNYNKDQVLVKNTRFISANGKLFYSKNRILIPVGKYVDVEVIAAEGGEEYNIEPTEFSIPGLAGLPQYHSITGKSFSPMKGGGEGLVITEEDLNKAKDDLTKNLNEIAKNSFKEQLDQNFVLLDKAISTEIIEISSSSNVGEEAQSFTLQIKGKIKSFLFKKSDAENLIKEFILSQITEDKKIYKESLKVNWNVESVDFVSKKMFLNADLFIKSYLDIKEDSLKEALNGKSVREAKILLENFPQIDRFQLKIRPLGVNKIPKNLKKINIKINLD